MFLASLNSSTGLHLSFHQPYICVFLGITWAFILLKSLLFISLSFFFLSSFNPLNPLMEFKIFFNPMSWDSSKSFSLKNIFTELAGSGEKGLARSFILLVFLQ